MQDRARQLQQRFQSTLPTRGSDFSARCLTWYPRLFQSTLPTRGSDEQYIYATADGITVSIHAPHEGERPRCSRPVLTSTSPFQSTLPTRGSDSLKSFSTANAFMFQSTLPTRGSDQTVLDRILYKVVSIHAPHEGERLHCIFPSAPKGVFQSTLPTRGSDLRKHFFPVSIQLFQSTLPTRGSDSIVISMIAMFLIVSIHAPHEGERPPPVLHCPFRRKFQSTLPTRGSDDYTCQDRE